MVIAVKVSIRQCEQPCAFQDENNTVYGREPQLVITYNYKPIKRSLFLLYPPEVPRATDGLNCT